MAMERIVWNIPPDPPEVPAELREAGYGALLASVLCVRGFDTALAAQSYLDTGPEAMGDPMSMADMEPPGCPEAAS